MYSIVKMYFYRYRCSKFFWISFAGAFLSGIVFGLSTSGVSLGDKGSFDDMFIVPIFVIECIFFSLMIGREYSDGTIRNQLIIGKRRREIFLAHISIAFFATTLLVLLFVAGFSITSFHATIQFLSIKVRFHAFLAFLFINYAWMTLFVCISLLARSREIGVLLNLVLIIAIMFSSYQIEHLLGQPEYIVEENAIESIELTPEEVKQVHDGTFSGTYWYESDENETLTYYKDILEKESIPNPRALGSLAKPIFTQLDYLLPYGQVNMYVSFLTTYLYSDQPEQLWAEYHDVSLFPIYSVLFMAVIILCSILLFERKNIK